MMCARATDMIGEMATTIANKLNHAQRHARSSDL